MKVLWIEIAAPAIVSAETFERFVARLADNKRFVSRNNKTSSLLQGLAACGTCGYGYYRQARRDVGGRELCGLARRRGTAPMG